MRSRINGVVGIMLDVNRPLAVCRPDSPGPHQGMLQDREVVACVHALIEQSVLQAWGNARTGETDRAGNDFSTLLAGQTCRIRRENPNAWSYRHRSVLSSVRPVAA